MYSKKNPGVKTTIYVYNTQQALFQKPSSVDSIKAEQDRILAAYIPDAEDDEMLDSLRRALAPKK